MAEVRITKNTIPAVRAALHAGCKTIAAKAAFDIEAHAKQHIQANGQIDTGNMQNSAYTVTSESSTYPGSANAHLLPAIDAPASDTAAVVAFAADYSAYQNYGTRYLPARPFLEPAVDEVRAGLAAVAGRILQAHLSAL